MTHSQVITLTDQLLLTYLSNFTNTELGFPFKSSHLNCSSF